MNKTVITLVTLMAGSASAMQRQIEHAQQQQLEKKKDIKHTSEFKSEQEVLLADLKTDMAAATTVFFNNKNDVAAINTAEPSIEKDHQRICPCCHDYSVNCPDDLKRLARGWNLTCGCIICGGSDEPLKVALIVLAYAAKDVAGAAVRKIGSILGVHDE